MGFHIGRHHGSCFLKLFPGHTNLVPVKSSRFCFAVQGSPFSLSFLSFSSIFYFFLKSPSGKHLKLPPLPTPPITIHPPPPFPRVGIKEGCLLREPLKLVLHPLDTTGTLEAKSFAPVTGRLRAIITLMMACFDY